MGGAPASPARDPSQGVLSVPSNPEGKLGLACRAEREMRPKAMPPFLLKSPSLEVPCSRALPKGLWPGQVIVLRGLVLPEPKDFTLSLRDQAARVPVMLRASFADRTLAWISPWGCKKLISAPFLFYPRRFFEVLLLCQEGGLKLALNGQGLGATSVHQRVLEQLRELRVSGSVQLYCVHH
uniref:Galectin n=2 Tax=Suricata suricatta TaxID=37032 RepID=A0A673VP06_SURSU